MSNSEFYKIERSKHRENENVIFFIIFWSNKIIADAYGHDFFSTESQHKDEPVVGLSIEFSDFICLINLKCSITVQYYIDNGMNLSQENNRAFITACNRDLTSIIDVIYNSIIDKETLYKDILLKGNKQSLSYFREKQANDFNQNLDNKIGQTKKIKL